MAQLTSRARARCLAIGARASCGVKRFLGISITRSALARSPGGALGQTAVSPLTYYPHVSTYHIRPACYRFGSRNPTLSGPGMQRRITDYMRRIVWRTGPLSETLCERHCFPGKASLASRQTSDVTTVLQSIRLSTVLFDSGLVVCAAYSRTAKTLALSKQTGDCASRLFVAVYLRRGWRLSGQLLSGYVAAHLQTRAFST